MSAQLDLQVITAVLNAHTTHAAGREALDDLQDDIETAVTARTDLDTPAGARALQRYLIGKLRDIKTVVETASLDDTSKAVTGRRTGIAVRGRHPDASDDHAPDAEAGSAARGAPATARGHPAVGTDPLDDALLTDDLGALPPDRARPANRCPRR